MASWRKSKLKQIITDPEIISRFMSKVKFGTCEDACWEWLAAKNRGYGIFALNRETESAHQISFRIFKGAIPDGFEIRHTCRGKCVNPRHVILGTYQDNRNDMKRDRTTNAKLNDDQITYLRNSSAPYRKLAKELGVCKSTVSNIKHGITCSYRGAQDPSLQSQDISS